MQITCTSGVIGEKAGGKGDSSRKGDKSGHDSEGSPLPDCTSRSTEGKSCSGLGPSLTEGNGSFTLPSSFNGVESLVGDGDLLPDCSSQLISLIVSLQARQCYRSTEQ